MFSDTRVFEAKGNGCSYKITNGTKMRISTHFRIPNLIVFNIYIYATRTFVYACGTSLISIENLMIH